MIREKLQKLATKEKMILNYRDLHDKKKGFTTNIPTCTPYDDHL